MLKDLTHANVWVHDQDGAVAFYTDRLGMEHGDDEELSKRGVEFQQEPTQAPYGIDAGFRGPSGNQIRMAQTT